VPKHTPGHDLASPTPCPGICRQPRCCHVCTCAHFNSTAAHAQHCIEQQCSSTIRATHHHSAQCSVRACAQVSSTGHTLLRHCRRHTSLTEPLECQNNTPALVMSSQAAVLCTCIAGYGAVRMSLGCRHCIARAGCATVCLAESAGADWIKMIQQDTHRCNTSAMHT
jgi:hypothetical protein